jgi:hypothetical protein
LISESDLSGYYRIVHGEDLVESLGYLRKCKSAFFLNESLYNYTVNYESVTHSVIPENFKIDFTVREMAYEFLEEEGVFTDTDWADYRTYCIKLICGKILRVLAFAMPAEWKLTRLKDIHTSEYFQTKILGKTYRLGMLGKKNNLIYGLLFIN